MKKISSIFLLCSLSFKLFSSHSSEDSDIATEELSKFERACEAVGSSRKIERKQAHRSRTSYENRQYVKGLTRSRCNSADDKSFRLGELPAGHCLELAYLQRVCTRHKKSL
jgi:hypothetical protein